MKLYRTCSVLALFALVALACCQGDAPPTVKIFLPKSGKAGAQVKGTVQITFQPGLHAYQNPPTEEFLIPVTVALTTKGAKLLPIKYPAGVLKSVGGDPTLVRVYEGKIKVPIVIVLPKKSAHLKLAFKIGFQQCNDQSCYMPSSVSASAPLLVK